MKFLLQKLILLTLVSLLLHSHLAALELSRDDFNNSTSGWSGTNVTQESGKLRINRDNTASKIFTFASLPNQAIIVTLDTTKIDTWESTDLLQITFNGIQVYNSNVTGLITLNGITTASGQLSINITPNTNANAEDIYIDDVIISYTPIPTISISNANVTEGNSGTKILNFPITLSAPSAQIITVNYTTANGIASSGTDYVAVSSGIITINSGLTTANAPVTINGDTNYESNETFTVTLTNPINASLATATAIGTITNDDTMPTLSIANASIAEGNTGTKNLTFTITQSSISGMPTTVNFSTSNGTAISGSDYVVVSNRTLTIPAGSTSITTDVTINGDTTYEPDETFTVTLTNPTNATIATATAVGTITNDDTAPTAYTCANPKTFQLATTTNLNGNLRIIGNSNLCYNNNGYCGDPGNARNNDINMMYSDPDGSTNPITFNSSSALLSLPVNSTVKWAKVYWQGYLVNKDDATKTSSKNVLFSKPNQSYQTIDASTSGYNYNWIYFDNSRYYYQGSADVTSLVQSGGNGFYSIANIISEIGKPTGGSFGGWSMVVVYEDPADTLKNITVFDGYQAIVTTGDQTTATAYASANGCSANTGTGNTMTIPLTGFLTPSNGAVNSRLGIFAGEGDKNAPGDHLRLTDKNANSISIYNGLNPVDDVFNSTITYNGATVTNLTSPVAITPYYSANSNGIDIDTFDVGTSSTLPIIGNSQTSTNVTLDTDGDGYMPGVFAFSTDIYAPNLVITKTPSTGLGGGLQVGAQIDYNVVFKNSGKEIAKDVVIFDDFTQNLLKHPDNSITSPSVYLSDLLDRNATKILRSIRLSDVNSSTATHCASGLSGISGCTAYDVNCSVDYTGDPQITATKAWCSVPKVDINASYTMKFSVNISEHPDTKNQEVVVENQMFASYKDNLTGATMPNSSSNLANAGNYNGITTTGAFEAWESGLSNVNPKLYTKIAGMPINFNIGKSDGSSFSGTVCAQIVSISGAQLADYNCSTYSSALSQILTWNSALQANKNTFVNIKTIAIADKTKADINSTWTDSNATDHFAIRPDRFIISAIGSPNLLKSGEDYNVSIIAQNYLGNPTLGYDQTKANLTIQMPPIKRLPNGTIDTNNTLQGNGTFGTINFNFIDGSTNAMSVAFSDVGKISLDINDTEWASIDANDTLISNRAIQGEGNFTFIPYQFSVLNARIVDSQDGNFTYLSNDLNMSAKLDFNISSQNKQGMTTQNFSSGLYENAITILPTIVDTLYGDANQSIINTSLLGFISGTKHVTWNDTNDSLQVKFNFSRNPSTPINPFDINASEVSISINSVYSDGATNVVIENNATNKNGLNNGTLGNAIFYYGRAHAPDYRFSGNSGTATMYYEVYAKDLNQSQRQAFGITGNQGVDSVSWYQNALHVNTLGVTNPSSATITIGAQTNATTSSVVLTHTPPHVGKVNLGSSSWLNYYPTDFTAEFYSSGSWAGAGFVKEGQPNATDTNTTVGEFIHKSTPVKANRRMTW